MSPNQPFVTTSATAAECNCGSVTDEDWSFVNSQIGFQVLSLITLWFYWWETTGCFPSICLARHSLCFERAVLSLSFPKGFHRGEVPLPKLRTCYLLGLLLKQWKIWSRQNTVSVDSISLDGHTQNAPRGAWWHESEPEEELKGGCKWYRSRCSSPLLMHVNVKRYLLYIFHWLNLSQGCRWYSTLLSMHMLALISIFRICDDMRHQYFTTAVHRQIWHVLFSPERPSQSRQQYKSMQPCWSLGVRGLGNIKCWNRP